MSDLQQSATRILIDLLYVINTEIYFKLFNSQFFFSFLDVIWSNSALDEGFEGDRCLSSGIGTRPQLFRYYSAGTIFRQAANYGIKN